MKKTKKKWTMIPRTWEEYKKRLLTRIIIYAAIIIAATVIIKTYTPTLP